MATSLTTQNHGDVDESQPTKPVFLSKAQREQLALERRDEEAAEQRRREAAKQRRKSLATESSSKRRKLQEEDRTHEREREEGERRKRAELEEQRKRERMELEAIKEQYLGFTKPKKRVVKPSDKFRFSFDWENSEDTSRDMNPLYQNPHEAQLLFGRGFRAGVDRREQKRFAMAAAKNQEGLIKSRDAYDDDDDDDSVIMNPAAAAEGGRVRRRKKCVAADAAYDRFDMREDRHWSEKRVEEMSERDWRIFREDFNISIRGCDAPKPMRNWDEAAAAGLLSPALLKAVQKEGYKKPSPIQMAAIPIGLRQRDVIGVAETGSGKTAAFVLPMLMYISSCCCRSSRMPPMNELENEVAEGPYALVMAPTRELALQIKEETVRFARYLEGRIRVASVVGGQSIEEQAFKLQQGCEIVIATPGRLLDCLERRYAVLNRCKYVVLDEADRMIDMGFEPQVIGVLDAMPWTWHPRR